MIQKAETVVGVQCNDDLTITASLECVGEIRARLEVRFYFIVAVEFAIDDGVDGSIWRVERLGSGG